MPFQLPNQHGSLPTKAHQCDLVTSMLLAQIGHHSTLSCCSLQVLAHTTSQLCSWPRTYTRLLIVVVGNVVNWLWIAHMPMITETNGRVNMAHPGWISTFSPRWPSPYLAGSYRYLEQVMGDQWTVYQLMNRTG